MFVISLTHFLKELGGKLDATKLIIIIIIIIIIIVAQMKQIPL
jgi:hypothetical protein